MTLFVTVLACIAFFACIGFLQLQVDGREIYTIRQILNDNTRLQDMNSTLAANATNSSNAFNDTNQSNVTTQDIPNSATLNTTEHNLANATETIDIKLSTTENNKTYAMNTTVKETGNITTSAPTMPPSANVTEIQINDVNSTQNDQAAIKKDKHISFNDTQNAEKQLINETMANVTKEIVNHVEMKTTKHLDADANNATSNATGQLEMKTTSQINLNINATNSTQKPVEVVSKPTNISHSHSQSESDNSTSSSTAEPTKKPVETTKHLDAADANNATSNTTGQLESTTTTSQIDMKNNDANSTQKQADVVSKSANISDSDITSTSTAEPTRKPVETTKPPSTSTSTSTSKPTTSRLINTLAEPKTEITQSDKAAEGHKDSSPRWSLQFEVSSNKSRTAISHYVKFKQFECSSERECKCVSMNVDIKIGDQVHRRLSNIKCHKILDHFRFGILPGIAYEFALSPNAEINGNVIGLEQKKFTISEPLPSDVVSFQMSCVVSPEVVPANNNALFQSLTQQISQLTNIDQQLISVFMKKHSKSGDKLKHLSIVVIFGQTTHNGRAQIGIEKIRNLYFERQHQSLYMLLSQIVRKSPSVGVSSITQQYDTQVIDIGGSEYDGVPGYGVGAHLFFICGLLLIVYVLCKLNAPNKLESVKHGMQKLAVVLHDFWLWVKPQITNSVINARTTLSSTQHQQAAEESRYTILRMSEDPEDREYRAGIKLLNEVFEQENVAPFQRQQYIAEFSEHWITKIEQLRQLNTEDYRRFGISVNLQDAIMRKLASIEQKYDASVRNDVDSRKKKEKFLRTKAIHTDENSDFSDF